jgi:hypothetical protein
MGCRKHVWVKKKMWEKFWFRNLHGERPHGKLRHEWDDNVEMDLNTVIYRDVCKLESIRSPNYQRCHKEETASHVLCDSRALAELTSDAKGPTKQSSQACHLRCKTARRLNTDRAPEAYSFQSSDIHLH